MMVSRLCRWNRGLSPHERNQGHVQWAQLHWIPLIGFAMMKVLQPLSD